MNLGLRCRPICKTSSVHHLLWNIPDSFQLTFIPHLISRLTHSRKDKNDEDTSSQKLYNHQRGNISGLPRILQFVFVTGMLAVVGSRVASLVVLEFCLRAVSGWVTAGPVRKPIPSYATMMTHDFFDYNPSSVLIHPSALFVCPFIPQESRNFLQQLLVQSQFSLGCALSCSLHFLHEGASHRWICLLLAASLSWFLARQATLMLRHVMALFKLHSSQRYCGICISLLTSGHFLLPMLCKTMVIAFFVAVVAAVSIINKHFLSATEALRFWTPLTICYTLLIVYMQGEKQETSTSEISGKCSLDELIMTGL